MALKAPEVEAKPGSPWAAGPLSVPEMVSQAVLLAMVELAGTPVVAAAQSMPLQALKPRDLCL